jgi:hypothetical protein
VVALAFVTRRKRLAATLTDEREERLARQVATLVGCAPGDALPAVRNELSFAPNQSDETLTKRATYHYRQSIPETVIGRFKTGHEWALQNQQMCGCSFASIRPGASCVGGDLIRRFFLTEQR